MMPLGDLSMVIVSASSLQYFNTVGLVMERATGKLAIFYVPD